MTTETQYTVYTDADRQWYFLVPNDETLPEGDFTVFTLIGRPLQVDPEALVPYEISRENAEEWVKVQLSQLVDQAADKLKGFFNSLYTKGQPNKDAPPKPETPPIQKRWGIEVIADVMGESVKDLQTDNDARNRGWQRLFADATVIFQAAKTGDSAQLSLAQARLNEIIRVLRTHDIPMSRDAERFVQQLHDAYRSDKPDASDE